MTPGRLSANWKEYLDPLESAGRPDSQQTMKGRAETTKQPVCLSIAGLDPSGGAGVLADVRTFAAFGCYPAAVVTSITFQNTQGVFGSVTQSGDTVRDQAIPVFDDFDVASVKTGMLPSREVIETVGQILAENGASALVVDPVVISTSGFDLIDDDALDAMVRLLFPVSLVVTPNIPEAERITGLEIREPDDLRKAGEAVLELGAKNVLIKGGHLQPQDGKAGGRTAIDLLVSESGCETFEAPFIETNAVHGTGCALSSAIAACLAKGNELRESVGLAKAFVNSAIARSPHLGKGSSPISI